MGRKGLVLPIPLPRPSRNGTWGQMRRGGAVWIICSRLDLIEERLPNGSVLARSQDAIGRPSGIAVAGGGDPGNPDQQVAYGYDTSGRFAAVTSTVGSVQSAFAYSYVPGSDLLAGWAVGGGISFRRTYEPSRDLIATVTNTWNGTALGTFGYENDSISRRTKRIDSGSVTNEFGYNPRSEVASAMMGANQFGYRYDPIGNRIASTNNAEAFSYAANELNQYTSIVDGGTVTPAYDDDGNLTSYGSWTYTWDGENRLVIATDGSVAVTNAYDFASRRAFKGTAVASRSFIYDGWNVIREFQVSGFSPQPSSFVWGLDLSQTLQGAGGVGGLLSVVRGDAPYFTGYDANGNVTDYVSANGTTVAHYEFDPFGNTTAATGSMADAFAHRFSTKYWDSETELYYYGHRFYRPEMGKWLSRDPIGEMANANLLAALSNAGIVRVDVLGLDEKNTVFSVTSPHLIPPPSTVYMPTISEVVVATQTGVDIWDSITDPMPTVGAIFISEWIALKEGAYSYVSAVRTPRRVVARGDILHPEMRDDDLDGTQCWYGQDDPVSYWMFSSGSPGRAMQTTTAVNIIPVHVGFVLQEVAEVMLTSRQAVLRECSCKCVELRLMLGTWECSNADAKMVAVQWEKVMYTTYDR